MPTTPTPPSHRPARRFLAASAALGLALSLTACTIGEVEDEQSPTAQPAQSTAPADAAPTDTVPDQAPEGPDAPALPVDQLVLGAQDAPELGLVAVSADELAGGIDSLEGLTAGLRVEPEACADFSQDAFLAQAEPGVMAIAAGQAADSQIAVAVTTLTSGIPDRERLLGDCPTMTVTIPIQGTEVRAETRNTLLPLDAPAGVEEFTAVAQDNSMDVMGQAVQTGTVLITGVVRGIGISVTATSGAGAVSQEARETALDTFAKQAEKVRAA